MLESPTGARRPRGRGSGARRLAAGGRQRMASRIVRRLAVVANQSG
jgi:hypothetical protein